MAHDFLEERVKAIKLLLINNVSVIFTSTFGGFFGLVLIALPFSQNLKNVNYKSIGIGIIFQIILAILLLKVPLIVDAFKFLGDGVIALQNATAKGTSFLFDFYRVQFFHFSLEDPSVQVQSAHFAFGILPFILVMSALTLLWLWHIKKY